MLAQKESKQRKMAPCITVDGKKRHRYNSGLSAPRPKGRLYGRSKRLSCRFVLRASQVTARPACPEKNTPSAQTVSRLTRYSRQCSAVLAGSWRKLQVLCRKDKVCCLMLERSTAPSPAFELTEHRRNAMGCFERGLSEPKASSAAIPLDFEKRRVPEG